MSALSFFDCIEAKKLEKEWQNCGRFTQILTNKPLVCIMNFLYQWLDQASSCAGFMEQEPLE